MLRFAQHDIKNENGIALKLRPSGRGCLLDLFDKPCFALQQVSHAEQSDFSVRSTVKVFQCEARYKSLSCRLPGILHDCFHRVGALESLQRFALQNDQGGNTAFKDKLLWSVFRLCRSAKPTQT